VRGTEDLKLNAGEGVEMSTRHVGTMSMKEGKWGS
jgi:hypothetical protein